MTDEKLKLSFLAYNTHLFGKVAGDIPIPLLTYQDKDRTNHIIEKINNGNYDFVGLNEVWDDDLAEQIIYETANVYPYYYKPTPEFSLPKITGPGLLLLSKYPLNEPAFFSYDNLVGIDQFGEKGVASAMVEIYSGGKQIKLILFLTHTQSDEDERELRKTNLIQLEEAIEAYQEQNPGALVFALGDFNVIGEDKQGNPTSEYDDVMNLFQGSQLIDCFREFHPNAQQEPGLTFDARENKLLRKLNPLSRARERLDYIFYSTKGNDDVTLTITECEVFSTGYIFEDRNMDLIDLSDHYPVLVKLELS